MESVIISVAGIVVAVLIALQQRKRSKVTVDASFTIEDYDPRTSGFVTMNSDAKKSIDVSVLLTNNGNLPVSFTDYVVGYPTNLISKFVPPIARLFGWVNHLPVRSSTRKRPRLQPKTRSQEIHFNGLDIAKPVGDSGQSEVAYVLLGVVDEHKNVYYSKPLRIELSVWLTDRGQWLAGII